MRKYSLWSILLLIGLIWLTACEDVADNPSSTPSADGAAVMAVPQNDLGLGIPTRTIKPIVSYTPRFTATPIPSATFTPSITPTATDTIVPPTITPTVSPSPTPTIEGIIRSTQRVNLRAAPDATAQIIVSVDPGTSLGVLGMQTDPSGRAWYQVAYINDDGTVQLLWVASNLVETDYQERMVQAQVTSTAQPGATASPGTPGTPGTAAPTRTPGATPVPNAVKILAYCVQKNAAPPKPKTTDKVYIEWSWYVSRPEYMDEHLAKANYAVRLDGKLLEDWTKYATEMKREAGRWIVYWYYPVENLSAGEHEITFELTWDAVITDGYANFGPGTPNTNNTGNCAFTVIEP